MWFFLLLPLSLAVALVATGCSSTPNLNYVNNAAAASFAPTNSARIALVIGPEVTSYHYEEKFGPSTRDYALGEPLSEYALKATKGVFKDVQVCSSISEAMGKADGILIPRVAIVNSTACVGAGSRHMLITIEWALMDSQNKALLWLDTARGKSSGTRAMTGEAERTLIQNVFTSLAWDTVSLLREAPAVQGLAAAKRG